MPALPTTPVPASAALPGTLTTFLGREREVAAVSDLLATTRLATLTGAGGSGKTRLAVEVARATAHRFAEGVAWVELAAITDPTLIVGHIATTLGIGGAGQSPADALRSALRDSEMLLVLDNCEHVIDVCAAVVELLLRDCAGLRVLATSREALGVAGERAWLVPVLSLPADGDGLDTIAQAEAVRLFVDRAQAASTSFALTESNAQTVARLCRRLDGLPLAIELAAARARALTPEQMLARLEDGFRLLESARKAAGRHSNASRDDRLELRSSRRARTQGPATPFRLRGRALARSRGSGLRERRRVLRRRARSHRRSRGQVTRCRARAGR